MTQDLIEITTTIDTPQNAQSLARYLVEQKLAGCVQISGPIQSVYFWQGQLCDSTEYRLQIKTLPAKLESLVSTLNEVHPYETPEILIQHGRSSDAYSRWMTDTIADDSATQES